MTSYPFRTHAPYNPKSQFVGIDANIYDFLSFGGDAGESGEGCEAEVDGCSDRSVFKQMVTRDRSRLAKERHVYAGMNGATHSTQVEKEYGKKVIVSPID